MAKKKRTVKRPRPVGPPPKWTPKSGITHSGLNKWMEDREQFSLGYIDGLRPKIMSEAAEFGNMWHLCEDVLMKAMAPPNHLTQRQALYECVKATEHYCRHKHAEMEAREKESLEAIRLCVIAIFQVYLDHYQAQEIRWYRREYSFRVPHPLGIELRGKRDGEYIVEINGVEGIGLWETKTKTKIDRNHLTDQLMCDSQSLFYLYSMHLEHSLGLAPLYPIHETYNVIKRPSIHKRKGESPTDYARRAALAAAEKPEDNFWREPFSIDSYTLQQYNAIYLEPQLRSFLGWWTSLPGPSHEERALSPLHYPNLSALINPYGRSSYFDALVYRQTSSLQEVDDIFPELAPDPSVEYIQRRLARVVSNQ